MLISRSRALLAAALLTLPLAACSGAGESTELATPPPVARQYTVPDNLCARLDYSIATRVFGNPVPLPVKDDDQGPDVRCFQMYQAKEGASGTASIRTQTFDSAEQARTAFERTAPTQTSAPIPGATNLDADAVRQQQAGHNFVIEILDGNLVLGVKLGAMGRLPDATAAELPETTVRVAAQALELIRAS